MSSSIARYLDIETEDDLTRIVFGILEMLGSDVLTEVLDIPDQGFSDDLDVEFHTPVDPRADRVPDVVIHGSTWTVMIEVKRGAEYDLEQLRDEYDDLRRYGNERTRLILVTGHESRPSDLDQINDEGVKWIGWKDVVQRVSRYDRSKLTATQRHLVELLQSKLQDEGYLPYTGISDRLLEELPTVWELSGRYYNQIARFHRDLAGRLGDHGLQPKNMWRDGISQDFNRFPAEIQYLSRHLWIAYAEDGVAVDNKQQEYLFVAFCIEGRERPMLRVGFSMSPKQGLPHRETIVENADEIADFVSRTDSQVVLTDWNFHVLDRFSTDAEIRSLLSDGATLTESDRVQLTTGYDSDELKRPDLPESVTNDLLDYHEFSQTLE